MAGMNPRPCPFCGGNEIVMESSNGEHWATCCQCEISGPREGSEPESILAWNTRRQERCAERCELQKAMDEFIGMNPPSETVPAPVQWVTPERIEINSNPTNP